MTQISILGCGWLGLPLAEYLIANGFSVNGSTTSPEKIELLKKTGINPFLISVSEIGITGSIEEFLNNSEILIIDIPPKIKSAESGNYVSKIENVISAAEKSNVKKILLVSSTSIYADDNSEVSENTIPKPTTEAANQLLESEKLLKANPNFKTTILRFGGLTGKNRHPIYYLAGRKNIENPYGPINLIHLEDCINIIVKIIEKDIWNETFNAVTPFHPTRSEYYTQKAKEFSLPLPEFSETPSFGKIINSDKLIQILGFKFKNKL